MLQFTHAQTGQKAEIPKGESFEISLPENPATGFRWQLTAGGEPVTTIAEEHFQPGTGVGGAGTRRWRFHAIATGEGKIAMVLQRSWESPAKQAQSFTLRVIVAG